MSGVRVSLGAKFKADADARAANQLTIHQLTTQLHNAKMENSHMVADLSQTKRKLSTTQDNLVDTQQQLKNLQADYERLQAKSNDQQSQIELASKTAQDVEDRTIGIRMALEEAQTEMTAVKAEEDRLTTLTNEQKKQLKQASRDIEQRNTELKNRQDIINKQAKDIQCIQTAKGKKEYQICELLKERKSLQTEIKQLRKATGISKSMLKRQGLQVTLASNPSTNNLKKRQLSSTSSNDNTSSENSNAILNDNSSISSNSSANSNHSNVSRKSSKAGSIGVDKFSVEGRLRKQVQAQNLQLEATKKESIRLTNQNKELLSRVRNSNTIREKLMKKMQNLDNENKSLTEQVNHTKKLAAAEAKRRSQRNNLKTRPSTQENSENRHHNANFDEEAFQRRQHNLAVNYHQSLRQILGQSARHIQ